ncbi:putative type IIS restriction/modification enzyme [Candidatus Moduliflexus flocculans]|uniref:site-specific DNA-methyltransferase (adenine-specific) n=1 Tax=Candidatus Moduliflexus flocculans TaxID=1499966 RepID=A0A0S6VU20_9BACT|nr:putative type IIS restriction/modification enzyme [Candidatus Moduliflexus flocculans]
MPTAQILLPVRSLIIAESRHAPLCQPVTNLIMVNTHTLTLRQALNKAFLKVKPTRAEIERFKTELVSLLDHLNPAETEEFHKHLLADFLKKTYYAPNHFINTKGRADLVIHAGKDAASPVGVIIETKKPTNAAEMPTPNRLDSKALRELVLYYLRERVAGKNLEIKHLIVTNVAEWFIFDAAVFEKAFAQNTQLVKRFSDFETGSLSGTTTDFFYEEIAKPAIVAALDDLTFTHVVLAEHDAALRNAENDAALIALLKIFSPEHLLKLPFANDSNSLNKGFYVELLHIIGLMETKEGNKKVIRRNADGERHAAALIENAIIQLDAMDKLSNLTHPGQFGGHREERLLNVALELAITWINRVLFLKLLEAQLLAYNNGDPAQRFLNSTRIKSFDSLNALFFQVLARQPEERNPQAKTAFATVPYLNSSLFELTELEQATIVISNLSDDETLPLHPATVLKDANGKKRTGSLPTLEYLFAFLDAYDFGSDGGEAIQEESKSLISASVLGLIFEKINGYRDGSFFTPGFITMYMCRETLRRAVVQKFNERKGWQCARFDDLYDKIEDRSEANEIVNSLRICDPAVGSGHFLVSALNELISIKSDLRILQDRQGKRLKEYRVEVVNDELIVTDDDGDLFDYRPGHPESQRVQEVLFHEKQTLIERCLFGVDINPNSVKICRLRLWIELLKHAYYLASPIGEGAGVRLETLPNIDINIREGNSLISRFALNADLKVVLSKQQRSIAAYRQAVQAYREARRKEDKREIECLIAEIKSDFRTEIGRNDPKVKRLAKLSAELITLQTQGGLFELSAKEQKTRKQQEERLQAEIAALTAEIEEIKQNKIYRNAFEWRFEFPEVLNDSGDFVGFDVVIGNPPYMRVQEIQASQPNNKLFYERIYANAKVAYDLANIFLELAINISSANSNNAYIFPHKFFNSASSEVFRDYLKHGQYIDKILHFGANMVFEDADTYTCVTQFSKKKSLGFWFQRFPFKSDFQSLMLDESRYAYFTYDMLERASKLYGSNQWILFDNALGFSVFEKIYNNSIKLENYLDGIFVGLQTSRDVLYILERVSETPFVCRVPISGKEYELEQDLFKPFLMGKDVQRYGNLSTDKYVFFPYKIVNGNAEIVSEKEILEKYPKTYRYIKDHEKQFKDRENGKAYKMAHWHAYIYPKNLNKFEQPKLSSMEICANHPNVTLDVNNFYHTTKVYSWVKKLENQESYEYLLAIANSQLLWWFLKATGDTLQGDARTFKTNYLNPFPLPKTVSKEKEKKIIDKVKEVLVAKQRDPAADTRALEAEIDRLVYALYGLTPEEIAMVEGNA